MQTILLPPNSDAGPNDGVPSPGGFHYLNVDEDPNDGDASYLAMDASPATEVFGMDVSAIPDFSVINSLTVRCVTKKGTSAAVAMAGLSIGGVYYYGAPFNPTASYVVRDFAMIHPDGQPWTKARIASSFIAVEVDVDVPGLAVPCKLTEAICFADITPPGRPGQAVGTSQTPSASGSSTGPGAKGKGTAPAAGPSSSAPRARGSSSVPAAAASSTAPGSRGSSSVARAVLPTDLPTLKVRVSSSAPRATASSSTPAAAVSSTPSSGEGS